MFQAFIAVTAEDFNYYLTKKFKVSACVASTRLEKPGNTFNIAYYM